MSGGRIRHLWTRPRPRPVLEIGTTYGGTLYLWTRAAAPDAHVISIDLPPWEHDDPWEAKKVDQFRAFARSRQTIDLRRADANQDGFGIGAIWI